MAEIAQAGFEGTPAASVQLDCTVPNFIIQEWFPYHSEEHYALVDEAFEPRAVNSYMPVPTRPGLGLELNDAVVSKFDCFVVK